MKLTTLEQPITLGEHTIALDHSRGTLAISAPSGDCIVEIALTSAGASIRLKASEVEIAAPQRLTLATDRFELRAREATLDVRESLVERIGGDARRVVGGTAAMVGRDVAVEASRGEIALHATDDVDVRGERVRLNCEDPPMPLSWEEHDQRRRAADMRLLSEREGA